MYSEDNSIVSLYQSHLRLIPLSLSSSFSCQGITECQGSRRFSSILENLQADLGPCYICVHRVCCDPITLSCCHLNHWVDSALPKSLRLDRWVNHTHFPAELWPGTAVYYQIRTFQLWFASWSSTRLTLWDATSPTGSVYVHYVCVRACAVTVQLQSVWTEAMYLTSPLHNWLSVWPSYLIDFWHFVLYTVWQQSLDHLLILHHSCSSHSSLSSLQCSTDW